MTRKHVQFILAITLVPVTAFLGAHAIPQAQAAIPADQALVISVNGRAFPIEVIRVRDKQVVFSTHEELGKFPDLKLTVNFGNTVLGNLSNKRLHFTGKSFSEPSLILSWKEAEGSFPKNIFVTKNYDMSLVFGAEKDYRIPLEFKLDTRQGVTMRAAGKHLAQTSDLVVVNGKVDIHQDNNDTVMYVAAQFIKHVDKTSVVKNLQAKGHMMSIPGKDEKKDPNPKRIYSSSTIDFDFDGPKGKETAKFQMVRDQTGWQVYRVLSPERLRNAKQVDLSLDSLFMYDYFGQQVVEKTFGKDKVQAWVEKGGMLQYRNPDPKRSQVQTGSVAYLVTLKDGSKRYLKLLVKKDGIWKIRKVLNGTQVALAHVEVVSAQPVWGSDIQKHLAAVRLEKELNKRYPTNLQIRSVNASCGYSKLLTQCKMTWYRLMNNAEQCEGTTYMYRRKDKDANWEFVRELAADEELDHRDGQVKKKAKPSKYFCW
jgi:hypothetical protein